MLYLELSFILLTYDALGCKIQLVSRSGTGTCSADNPCTLSFNFVPHTIFCLGWRNGNFWGCSTPANNISNPSPGFGIPDTGASYISRHGFTIYSNTNYIKASSDYKTIYWYNENNDPEKCLNVSGDQYMFIGITY